MDHMQIKKVKVENAPKDCMPNKELGQHVPNPVDGYRGTVDEARVGWLFGTENDYNAFKKTTWPKVEEFPTSKNICSESKSEGQHVVKIPQYSAAEEPGKPCEIQAHPFTIQRDHDPFINFTIPPKEEDLQQLQSVQDKNGHIKRPMNAFFVWAQIHRNYLQKAFPLTTSKDISIQLGQVWSILTDEQKRPYYEAAHKLRILHDQKFPDYQYQPKKRKCKEQFTRQRVNLAEGQQQALRIPGFVSQAIPLAQPNLPDVCMNTCPVLMPSTLCNHPYSAFPCYQIDYFSMFQIHSPRIFHIPTSHHQYLHGGTEYQSLHSPAGSIVFSGSL